MTVLKPIMLLSDVAKKVNLGRSSDIDYFMSYLNQDTTTQIIKLIDFALSQINTTEGIERIKYYLFNGSLMQRNYAALYFKRHKKIDVLKEAVSKKCIDKEIAFSK